MTGFIVNVSPFRNRVSSKEAFEGLELGEGKLSRPVLRGPGGRKAAWLLGDHWRCHRTGLLAVQGAPVRLVLPVLKFQLNAGHRGFLSIWLNVKASGIEML